MADSLTQGRACFVGCGKMGEAMLAGWMASEDASASALRERGFCVVAPREERAALLASRYGVSTFASAAEVPSDVSFVILAVAPFNLLKGVLVSVIVMLIYKKISPVLKMK